MIEKIELLIDAKATLGESPSWDGQSNRLYWVDIIEKRVFIYDPVSKENRIIQLEQAVGAIVPRTKEEVMLVLENGFYSLNITTEHVTLIKETESDIKSNRFNDGKCDAKGRFWAGTMNTSFQKQQGALYCLNTNGNVTKKRERISISNGIAWSPNNEYMYYIDTLTKNVVRFQFDVITGKIQNPTEIIDFEREKGLPDGMTIDEEGMLWIAHWGGSEVSRWNPSTGQKLYSIKLPALHVTSCTFGGYDLKDLYITTARTGMDDSQLKQYPYAGGLFKVRLDVKGTSTNSFRG